MSGIGSRKHQDETNEYHKPEKYCLNIFFSKYDEQKLIKIRLNLQKFEIWNVHKRPNIVS